MGNIENCVGYMTNILQFSICITAIKCNLNHAVIHKRETIVLIGIFSIIFSLIFLMATPSFIPGTGGNTSYIPWEIEDQIFNYNLTANVTYQESDLPLIFTLRNISSTLYSQVNPSFYYWISLGTSNGILTINSTNDNQTGKFNISIEVTNPIPAGQIDVFYFVINASNDAPNITSINNSYNLTANTTFVAYVNGSDEENMWPLVFNLSFFSNCTKTPWNNRTNCNLFNFVNVSNSSSMINFTSTKYDSGFYWANVSVMDFGANYTCSSGYCLANYSQNRTFLYSRVVQFNVYSYLDINATDCQNKIFQENQSGSCRINITSREFGDNITFTSNASLRNSPSFYVSNSTWFIGPGSNSTYNYTTSVLINVTPQKDAIGNWTINFSATDINFSENSYSLIYVYVNRTLNDIPRFKNISNINTSISAFTRINITAYDDDFLIPDKLVFNESLNFTLRIANQSDLSQIINLTNYNFTINVTSNPVSNTNRTEGKIEFTPNISIVGNYSINITATDRDGINATITFNLSIKSNLAPLWNASLNRSIVVFEHNYTYLNLSNNISDPNIGDVISFEYSSDSFFPSFSMNLSTGIINFTTNDSDVGLHVVTVIASDGYLTNTTTINFTITNVNETPVITRPMTLTTAGPGGGGNSSSGMTAVENYLALVRMYVEDPDSGILSGQRSYYNENITIQNLSITGGPNSNLFSFSSITQPGNLSNTTTFQASFIPAKTDVGNYTITINVSDVSGKSDIIAFNLLVNAVNNAPVLSALSNQTSAVNRSFYYRINASDLEDGNSTQSGNLNFTFTYSFLNGTDFINNNQSIFNSTTGELNITFNSSQGGRYRLNITVNDTSGYNDTDSFWIYVYDSPVFLLPSDATQYLNLSEGSSYVLNFTLNHSVGDNLTCEFYVETPKNGRLLRYNISYYGNGTVLAWNFSTNYTDESLGMGNLTVIAYPSTSSLANATSLNTTKRYNMTINQTNAPLQFLSNIGGASSVISGGSPQQISLSDYFYDIDAVDRYHNQTITFTYNTLSSSGTMSVNYTNWQNGSTPTITFSSSGNANATYTITAYEWNESNSSIQVSNLTSNTFTVRLNISTETVVVTTPTSGGGGGGSSSEVPYSLKIIVPTKISAYTNQKITIPLKLLNSGKETFKGVSLSALGFKGGKIENAVKISFDRLSIGSLAPGASQNFTMTVLFGTNATGDYEITVNATSKSPSYMDWSKIYVNLQKINESEVKKYLLFTEEYIVQNPNCLELKERLKEAEQSIEKGDYATARVIAENVLDTCKQYVEQASIPKKTPIFNNSVLEYLMILIFISIFAGLIYYFIKRRGYSRNYAKIKYLEESNNYTDKMEYGQKT